MAVKCSGFGVSQYLLVSGYMDIQIFSHFPRPAISALASQNISLGALSSLLRARVAGAWPTSSPPPLLLREDVDQGGRSRKAPGSGRERFHPHGLHQLPHAPAQLPGRGLEDDFGEGPGAACLLVTLAALSSEPRNPDGDPNPQPLGPPQTWLLCTKWPGVFDLAHPGLSFPVLTRWSCGLVPLGPGVSHGSRGAHVPDSPPTPPHNRRRGGSCRTGV